jgi:hypothetical protein
MYLFSFIFCDIEMTNQELVDVGRKKMDETDQAIERSKQVPMIFFLKIST